MERHYLTSDDGHRIHLCQWKVKNPGTLRAIIHINHGMAEHGERYAPIAAMLNRAGIDVIAHDHRGHGGSVGANEATGYFAERHGWKRVLSDVDRVQDFVAQNYPDLPVFVHGQSMGSFIAQSYCSHYNRSLSGVILTGSTYNPPLALVPPKLIARLEKARSGPKARSTLIHFLSFQRFNRTFKNTKTEHDWLTRSTEEIERYENDPWCGFLCTNQLWIDLLNALQTLGKKRTIGKIDSKLPFYLISGERDPISYDPKQHRITALRNHLVSGGIARVDYKLYPDARHEILNELNRDDVINDMIRWIENKL